MSKDEHSQEQQDKLEDTKRQNDMNKQRTYHNQGDLMTGAKISKMTLTRRGNGMSTENT